MNRFLDTVDPYSFTGSAFLIGLFLANELTSDEQDSVGNWLQLVGLTIQTYASQVTTVNQSQASTPCKDQTEKTSGKDNSVNLSTIQKALQKMQEELAKLKQEKKESS